MRSLLSLCLCLTACSPAPMLSLTADRATASVGDTVNITLSGAASGSAVTFAATGGTVNPTSAIPSASGTATTQLTTTAAGAVTVTATQSNATATTSVTFTSGPRLRFQVSPVNSTTQNLVRGPGGTQLQVVVEENGATVTSSSASVTLAVTAGSCSAQLDSTSLATVNAQQGVASFAGIKITTAANGCTLTATSGSMPSAVSSSFNITP